MKKITLLLAFLTISAGLFAQDYSTPGNGSVWTLDDLMTDSPETVSFEEGVYTILQDFTISSSDELTFNAGEIILIEADVQVTIEGILQSLGSEESPVNINAVDSLAPYDGFRFNSDSYGNFDHTILKNGGGLRVITEDFSITNSTLAYNTKGGVNTGGVINFSGGTPLVENNIFLENALPAIGAGANSNVAAQILNNYMEGNSASNPNRPQINIGSTGADTLRIIGNTIIGNRDLDKVGGISVANLIGGLVRAEIHNNVIVDNRYGINIQGAGDSYIEVIGNIIEDNDTQGQPMVGGSGVSINSGDPNQVSILRDNQIRRNLWGITIIGSQSGGAPTVNLGDDDSPGNNIFSDNGNGGVTYALYNNSAGTVMAKYNCWTEDEEMTYEDAEEVIVHVVDDATLGEVIFDPIDCGILGISKVEEINFNFYPNPAAERIYFDNNLMFEQLVIFDITGKAVKNINIVQGENAIDLNLNSGMYIMQFRGTQGVISKKLMVK